LECCCFKNANSAIELERMRETVFAAIIAASKNFLASSFH
jgi:hypothetical protein